MCAIFIAALMHSQHQEQTPGSTNVDLYSAKPNLTFDPVLYAQQALMQANFDATSRQHHLNHQQQQVALAMANLLGQCNPGSLLSMQHQRDLCKCPIDLDVWKCIYK